MALEKLLASRASVSSSVNGTRVSDRIEKSQNVTQLLSPLSCHHGNETCLLRCEKSSLAKSTCARTSVPQSPPRVCTVHLGNWDLRCSPEHPVTVQNPKIHGKAVWESQPDSSLRIYGAELGKERAAHWVAGTEDLRGGPWHSRTYCQPHLLDTLNPLLLLLRRWGGDPVHSVVPFHHAAVSLRLTGLDYLVFIVRDIKLKAVLRIKEERQSDRGLRKLLTKKKMLICFPKGSILTFIKYRQYVFSYGKQEPRRGILENVKQIHQISKDITRHMLALLLIP